MLGKLYLGPAQYRASQKHGGPWLRKGPSRRFPVESVEDGMSSILQLQLVGRLRDDGEQYKEH